MLRKSHCTGQPGLPALDRCGLCHGCVSACGCAPCCVLSGDWPTSPQEGRVASTPHPTSECDWSLSYCGWNWSFRQEILTGPFIKKEENLETLGPGRGHWMTAELELRWGGKTCRPPGAEQQGVPGELLASHWLCLHCHTPSIQRSGGHSCSTFPRKRQLEGVGAIH